MIEYIFHARNDTAVPSFLDNISPFEIDGFDFVILVEQVIFDNRFGGPERKWGAFIETSDLLISPTLCEIITYPIPKGGAVQFRWSDNMDEQITHKIIQRIIDRARLLGFNPEELSKAPKVYTLPGKDDKIPSTRKVIRGMRKWRKRRAHLFKEIKDQFPNLSMVEVARKATDVAYKRIRAEIDDNSPKLTNDQLEINILTKFKEQFSHGKDEFLESDVKNDYRVMNWQWIDSRKIT